MYSKYHAKKVTIDGHTFDSIRESKRYQELKLLEKAKEIKDLKLQVPFVLINKSEYGREIKYTGHSNGMWKEYVVEDSKGYRTDVYKLKKRLFEERYKIKIKET